MRDPTTAELLVRASLVQTHFAQLRQQSGNLLKQTKKLRRKFQRDRSRYAVDAGVRALQATLRKVKRRTEV